MNIEHYQRNTFSRALKFTQNDDTAFDLTGASLEFVLRPSKDSSDLTHSKVMSTIPNPTEGVVNLTIAPAVFDIEAGEYYYEIRLTSSSGVQTLLSGEFVLLKSIVD